MRYLIALFLTVVTATAQFNFSDLAFVQQAPAAAGAFNVTNISGNYPRAYFVSDDLVMVGSMKHFTNRVGLNSISGANVGTNGINNGHVVINHGVSGRLADSSMTLSQPIDFVIFTRLTNNFSAIRYWWSGISGDTVQTRFNSSAVVTERGSSGSNPSIMLCHTNVWEMFIVRWDNASSTGWTNVVNGATVNNNGGTFTGLYLGHDSSGVVFDWTEMIIYTNRLTQTDVSNLYNYFTNKYSAP